MKRFVVILLVLAVIVAGLVAYLVSTTPKQPAGVRFPLPPSQKALLSRVPADAEAFAIIPTAAAVHRRLLANPITRDAVRKWTDERQLPPAWMIGAADVVVWRSADHTGYAIELDPVRRFLVRLTGAKIDPPPGPGIGAAELEPLLALAERLDPGDAFVVQRSAGRGAFPPIGRPSVSTVRIERDELSIASRADADPREPRRAVKHPLPHGAMIAAWFADSPRVLRDLDRLLASRISPLAEGGGSIIIYEVNAGTLLPRPRGLLVVPETDEAREAALKIRSVAEAFGELKAAGGQIRLAFDATSMRIYEGESFVESPWPATEWAVRIDVQRLLPVLHALGDSTGLRIAAPRIYRSARDLRRWMDVLAPAQTIEGALAHDGRAEELRVRVRSK
jgi:hypothetical protein